MRGGGFDGGHGWTNHGSRRVKRGHDEQGHATAVVADDDAGIHKSAEAIAAAQHKPEIMDKFRLTYGENDTTLAANALAFATAAQPMESAFLELGHSTGFIQALKDEVAAFKAADDDQNVGAQARSGATRSIEPLVRQGMIVLKQLDALMHNKYAGNAEKLGAWLTASHIEKVSHKAKASATPTPPAG
ncbi:MAG: hypothetical protein WDM76_08850 [Limisphaerales bacterium]